MGWAVKKALHPSTGKLYAGKPEKQPCLAVLANEESNSRSLMHVGSAPRTQPQLTVLSTESGRLIGEYGFGGGSCLGFKISTIL
jgi:hypothetical protein